MNEKRNDPGKTKFEKHKYVNEYNKKNYVVIMMKVRPHIKKKIEEMAKEANLSKTSFIVQKVCGEQIN